MSQLFENAWFVNVLSGLICSLILFLTGYFIGKKREIKKQMGKRLEEYDFYPFSIDKNKFPVLDWQKFNLGVNYFSKNYDYNAARQLIIIGEQNNVSYHLNSGELRSYKLLFKKYNGNMIMDDSVAYLENYKQLVKLIGRTFKGLGIEILLHNLVNPSKSIIAIENPITGRHLEDGTTLLLLDLKKRKMINQDKLNYQLSLGQRRFKCTTIPIFRPDYGLVAAICINIDVNYISDEVLKSKENIQQFFRNYCSTEMKVDENILSQYEYELALQGKKHWKMSI